MQVSLLSFCFCLSQVIVDFFAAQVAPGEEDHEEEIGSDSLIWKNQHKHFFVLSEAGKPIYTRYLTCM